MKRTTKVAITVAALAGLGLTTWAATGYADRGRGDNHGYGHHERGFHGAGPHRGSWRHGARFYRLLDRFDANQDGKVTQAEIDQARQDRLKRFDSDGDGVLTLAEYEALWLDAMRERMVNRFQDHDADGDGKVTQAEFGRRFSRMVERMDRNDDGVIDKSDRRHRFGAGDRGPRPMQGDPQ